MANAFKADHDILTANDDGVAADGTRFCFFTHTFEGRDLDAVAMARYQLSPAAGGSYHGVIDREGVTARENDDAYIPWAAMFTGNRAGWHWSLAGQAAFTREQWLARPKQLAKLAEVLASYAKAYDIPLIKRDHIQLVAGKHGVAGHADISKAWKESDHTDPGVNFPYDVVIADANKILTAGTAPTPAPERPAASIVPPGKKYPSYLDGRELRFSEYLRFIDEKVTQLYDEHMTDQAPPFAVAIESGSVGDKYPSYVDSDKSFTLDQYMRLVDFKVDVLRKVLTK